MKYEVYGNIEVTDDFDVFEFISNGRRGNIRKRVAFTETEQFDIYNLAFGVIDEADEINDLAVSDNGDRNKVLATVVSIVEIYTKRYPSSWIIFKGSTPHRTRLYRMAVSLHLEELSLKFDIYANVDEKLVTFVKNLEINRFLIKRKKA
jgi:hypothetical protein